MGKYNTNINFGCKKSANTDTNTNFLTGICEYIYNKWIFVKHCNAHIIYFSKRGLMGSCPVPSTGTPMVRRRMMLRNIY